MPSGLSAPAFSLREHYSLSLLTPYRKHTLVTSESFTLLIQHGLKLPEFFCNPSQILNKCKGLWLNVGLFLRHFLLTATQLYSSICCAIEAKKAPDRTATPTLIYGMSVLESHYQEEKAYSVEWKNSCINDIKRVEQRAGYVLDFVWL